MDCEFTNDLDLYHNLGLDKSHSALFVSNDGDFIHQLPDHPCWNQCSKIFLVCHEGFAYSLLKKTQHPNLWVWDSVLPNGLDRHHIYLELWDSTFLFDRAFDTTSRLTNPLERCPQHLFDALLGKKRDHRDFIVESIDQRGLQKHFSLSYRPLSTTWLAGSELDQPDKLVAYGYDINDVKGDDFDLAVELNGMHLCLGHLLPWQIYNNTWFSIITETKWDDNFDAFTTEKTARALMAKRLFVFFGGRGALAGLRSLGFQTFGHVIDESYDSIVDPISRWQHAFQQVEYLCNQDPREIYIQCLPQITHNQMVYAQVIQKYCFGAVTDTIRRLSQV